MIEYSVISRLIWIFLAAIEIGMYNYLLFRILLDKKYMRKFDIAVMCISLIGMSLLVASRQIQIFFQYTVFLSVLLVLIFSTWMVHRRQLLLIAGIASVYFAFTSLLDFSFAFLEAYFVKSDINGLIAETGIDVEHMLIYACVASRMIMALIVFGLRKSRIKKNIEDFQGVLLAIGCMLVVLALEYQKILEHGITFSTLTALGITKANIFSSMVTLLTTVAIAGAFGMVLLKNRSIKQENEFLALQEEMQKQKYEELTAALEKNRELVHDTKNHYLMISEYERTGEYEKLHQYVEELKNSFVKINPQVYTGNRILDLVLSQKRLESMQKGISFELDAMPLAKLPLKDREICSLFGNLLDNAVEACVKVHGERKIRVKIKNQKHLIFIEIANSMDKAPIKEGQRFLTAKQDKRIHGYGLRSVQRIVETYEGDISYEVKPKEFVVYISFFDIGQDAK